MNKKIELKRLLVYLAFSFGLAWVWFLVTNIRFETWQEMSDARESFIALGMLAPLLAHILTRLVTKEGFKLHGKDSMMLGISLKDGKWIFFVLAILLPWFYNEARNAVAFLISKELFDPEYYVSLGIEKRMLAIFPLAAIISGTLVSFAAFGEEAGWRGYMMPKLLKLFGADDNKNLRGKILAVIVGGIIWGLWHAPLTCTGHNFGTDYPGFPFVGIAKMCLLCILLGIILTYITVKSGSVWPAAIMHAVNNTSPGIMNGFLNPDNATTTFSKQAPWTGYLVVLGLIAVVLMIIWNRKKENVDTN